MRTDHCTSLGRLDYIMTHTPRFLSVGVLAALWFATGCSFKASSPDTPGETALRVSENSSKEGDESPFVEQGLEQLGSPFTKETVLELNSIVARSLEAINEFDAKRRVQQHRQPSTSAPAATYATLSKKARQARLDMETARSRLLQSGEPYNEAILAAMVRFVNDVDREIALDSPW